MGEVKSAFEKAMEKIKGIEGLTSDEKEDMKDREKLKSLLTAFYKRELARDEIWEKFKGIKSPMLIEAQQNMADSLRSGLTSEEVQHRKEGILAIEALKKKRNTAAIENIINSLEKIQKEYNDLKKRALKELRAAVEQNPQLRMRPVRTPDGKGIVQATMSVDEAVQAKMAEFLAEHEKRYETVFNQTVMRLREELR